MIQRYLANELKKVVPDLEWTADFYTAEDHTGTVYSEGGSAPNIYETGIRYPAYMVYIRSSAWSYAETAAQKVFDAFHRKGDFTATINEYDRNENVIGSKSYHVFFVAAASDPLRIGVQDNIMEYSVNLDVTLTEIKEEMTNGA